MDNNSETESITFGAVQLIGAQDIEFVEAFTTDMDHQVAVGAGVPPRPDDPEQSWSPEDVANWYMRTPLAQTALGPGEYRALMLVVHLTSTDNCLFAQGFRLHYREFGHDMTVVSNLAMLFYYGSDGSGTDHEACSDVENFIFAHPLG